MNQLFVNICDWFFQIMRVYRVKWRQFSGNYMWPSAKQAALGNTQPGCCTHHLTLSLCKEVLKLVSVCRCNDKKIRLDSLSDIYKASLSLSPLLRPVALTRQTGDNVFVVSHYIHGVLCDLTSVPVLGLRALRTVSAGYLFTVWAPVDV